MGLEGLYVPIRDSSERIEDKINESFHLFRDLLIIVCGGNDSDSVDTFYQAIKSIYDSARQIIELQETNNPENYARAHLQSQKQFHSPLLDAVRDYDPDLTDPILEEIESILRLNYIFILARPTAKEWDLSLIHTDTSLDIVQQGIAMHRSGRTADFHRKYKSLLQYQ